MAAMTPDREAFLRKLEGGQEQMRTPTDDTLRFLKENGLDSTPIDPASLEALEKMVTPMKKKIEEEEDRKPAAVSQLEKERTIKFVLPVQEVQTHRELKSATSDITATGVQSTTETNRTTAGSEEISVENSILHQLEVQTSMIMEMQRRIDHLTNMVHHMAGMPPGAQLPQAAMLPPQNSMRQPSEGVLPPAAAPVTQQPRAAVPEQPPLPPPRTLFGSICDWSSNLLARVRISRTAEVWRVFWALHRRHVRLDGGLVFKVLIAVAVFSAKLMSRRNKTGDFWSSSVKFNLVLFLVFVGFLIQSGYINFFHRFLIRDKIVERIYGGEDIDVDQLNWDVAAVPRNNRNNNLRNLIPRNHMLAGNIPAPRNGINVLTDIVVLFGSFLLSILPMWKPAGPREREAQMAQEHAQRQMNVVAPPPDLDQHAADDDEDEHEGHAHQD